MPAFIVNYDLMKQGQNYDCIIKKLEAYTHVHIQQSAWILLTDQTFIQVRDSLSACLDENDKIFVGQLSGAAWRSMGKEVDAWLAANIR